MRLIIIGFGYLGSIIYENLSKKYKVIVISRNNNLTYRINKNNYFNIKNYKKEKINKLIQSDDIILFTASPTEDEFKTYSQSKLNSYLNFYDNLLKTSVNKNVSQFILFSSVKIYSKGLGINENSPIKINSIYTKVKNNLEKKIIIYKAKHNTKFKIIRISNVFGLSKIYNDNFDKLIIPSMLKSIFCSKELVLYYPNLKKDFLSTYEFIFKLKKVIDHKIEKKYEVYNICSYKSFSLINVSKTIKNIIKEKFGYNFKLIIKSKERFKLSYKTKHKFLIKDFDDNYFNKELTKLIIFFKNKYD